MYVLKVRTHRATFMVGHKNGKAVKTLSVLEFIKKKVTANPFVIEVEEIEITPFDAFYDDQIPQVK